VHMARMCCADSLAGKCVGGVGGERLRRGLRRLVFVVVLSLSLALAPESIFVSLFVVVLLAIRVSRHADVVA
jgi:hypothetical protein